MRGFQSSVFKAGMGKDRISMQNFLQVETKSSQKMANEENIVEVAKPQRFRHRVLMPGEKYSLPPSRGVPIEQITPSVLEEIRKNASSDRTQQETDGSGISAIRWFGRKVGTSRKFVEEIFYRSEVDPLYPSSELSKEQITSLALACTSLLKDLEQSNLGYLLVPDEKGEVPAKGTEVGGSRQEDRSTDVDVCPIVPQSWRILEQRSLAKVLQFPSFQ